MQLERKRMIVTGGASGIAAATVLAYAREGAAVVSLDIDDDAGRAVVDEAAGLGPGPITWPASSSRCPVGVLLEHGFDDLLGRLVQAGVHDVHAGVAERAR